jgi:hypothetical protein
MSEENYKFIELLRNLIRLLESREIRRVLKDLFVEKRLLDIVAAYCPPVEQMRTLTPFPIEYVNSIELTMASNNVMSVISKTRSRPGSTYQINWNVANPFVCEFITYTYEWSIVQVDKVPVKFGINEIVEFLNFIVEQYEE